MSTMRECSIFKAKDGRWYMLLGNFEYAFDPSDCTMYGPFASEEDAIKELDYHSNPGGYSVDDSGVATPPKLPRAPSRIAGRIPLWRVHSTRGRL